MRDANEESVPLRTMFRFRSGGWVLVLALLIGVLIIVFTLAPALQRIAGRPPGDGRNPDSYGFVLEPAAMPAGQVVAAQLHRDMTRPLVDPEPITPAAVTAWAQENRGKYLVSSDPVVGVVIDGEARAFPLGWMHFHEIANDVLGGVPILIISHPLSRTIAVYERRVDGRPIEFGTSGLMWDSTMLLYARERAADGSLLVGEPGEGPGEGQTLWDPRTGAAVTGPDLEAERALPRVPFVVTHYGDWLRTHPDTTIMSRNPDLLEYYKKAVFERYWAADELLYPIAAQPPMPPRRLEACIVLPAALEGADVVVPASWIDAHAMAPVAAVAAGATRSAGSADPMVVEAATADPARTWWIEVDGRRIGLQYRDEPESITAIAADGGPVVQVHSAWFSWWSTGRPVRIPAMTGGPAAAPGIASFDPSPNGAAAEGAGMGGDRPAVDGAGDGG